MKLPGSPMERMDADSSLNSRKRKATTQEIEIDISAAEPPSKKALRKEKKKTSQKSDKSLDTITDPASGEESREDSKDHQTAEKSEYGVWMGNLPFTVTTDDIKKFLLGHSSIAPEQITRLHVPTSKDSSSTPRPPLQAAKVRNKGFAYVDLSTVEALEAALSLSEKLISGRRVLIKDAKDFKGRPEKPKDGIQTTDAKPRTNRIFIGNLSFDTTKEDLEEHFARCGEVSDVHVATFEDSGKCKGYAWVTFGGMEAAALAVRGWVTLPPEEASSASEAEGEDDPADASRTGKGGKKQKLRKWWVNRIKGRPLRMEFAEDKAVRYKKRFGKDGTAKSGLQHPREDAFAEPDENSPDINLQHSIPHSEELSRARHSRKRSSAEPTRVKTGHSSIEVSRLTGGIVESQGKKTVFG